MRTLLRRAGYVLAGLLLLILTALAAVYGLSELRIRRTYAVADARVVVTADSAAIAHGAHVAAIRGCFDCHGDDYAGRVMVDNPLLGRLAAANLTGGDGSRTAAWTDADWERAIRHGIGPDGRALRVMPSEEYAGLTDTDLAALVAYLRSLPRVDAELPNTRIGPLGRALFLAGQLPLLSAERIDHAAQPAATVAAGPTAAYGAYLAAACRGCHGADLAGGRVPGAPPSAPPAADLTTGGPVSAWSEAEFIRVLREGVRPDGSTLDPMMPVRMTGAMRDDELRALYAYFKSLPPRAKA